MNRRLPTISLALLFSVFAHAGQVLQYGPVVMEVTGKITAGKAQHPNQSWFEFQLINLDKPASIKGDDSGNSFDVSEPLIKEIQIYSGDAALRKKLSALVGKKAVLKGTLYHAHTAWHIRELVLTVTEAKAAS
jgi:hypothetical protein